MASLRKHRTSRFWFACYSLPDGSRVQRSTKTKDKAQALQIALTLERASRMRATEDQARVLLSDLVQRLHESQVSTDLLADYIQSWLNGRAKELSPNTLASYRKHLHSLASFSGPKAGLQSVSAILLTRWRDGLADTLSSSTVNLAMKAVGACLQDAYRQGLIAENPARRVRPLRKSVDSIVERVPFTSEQAEALLASARAMRAKEWYQLILAGMLTGQRLADIASMRWDDLELADRALDASWWRFRTRKTGLSVAVPILPDLVDAIRALPQVGPYVFPVSRGFLEKSAMRSGTLSNQFHRIMVHAGLVPARPHVAAKAGRSVKRAQSPYSFHCLRHTLTTWLKSSGAGEAVAMAIVGHENKQVSRSYTHLPEQTLLEAMNRLPRLAAQPLDARPL